jgi:hypothetical protein
MAGNLSIETCGNVFQSREASSNYGIGSDGRVGMYVEEKDRSWASANAANDHRAVTIEVANSETGGQWPVSDQALATLIDLCVDICKRNNIPRLNFTGDKSGNLTMHSYFIATECPGSYLRSKFQCIADEVNRRLAGNKDVFFRVQVGAFNEKKNAEAMRDNLKKQGYKDAFVVEAERK